MIEKANTIAQKIFHPTPLLGGVFVGGPAFKPDTGIEGCGSIRPDVLLSCSKSMISPFKKSMQKL